MSAPELVAKYETQYFAGLDEESLTGNRFAQGGADASSAQRSGHTVDVLRFVTLLPGRGRPGLHGKGVVRKVRRRNVLFRAASIRG